MDITPILIAVIASTGMWSLAATIIKARQTGRDTREASLYARIEKLERDIEELQDDRTAKDALILELREKLMITTTRLQRVEYAREDLEKELEEARARISVLEQEKKILIEMKKLEEQ